MDDFAIPERIESVVPAGPARRQGFVPDQRRRRSHNPVPPELQDDDSSPAEDDEDLHEVDEIV
jgi:hypothetical protein